MHATRCCARVAGAIITLLIAGGCENDAAAPLPESAGLPSYSAAAPPGLLVAITVPGRTLSIWPYTGMDFTGTPQDPINLVFTGKSDPRMIRAALMSLGGDRTAFGLPAAAPFDCTWSDAIGDLQTGYNASSGWVGSAIQLACGGYGPVRFHVRLFEAGNVTLGNAHFEVLIPGTADHQVLSWELAEQLVKVDFLRSGLLDASAPLGSTDLINAVPFREIPEQIYNGLPLELRSLIGGSPGNVTASVPIATDGHATLFNLSSVVERNIGSEQRLVIQYGQVIPRPFCGTGTEFLYVAGPVSLSKVVRVDGAGGLSSEFTATGTLQLTPVDAGTGSATGPTYLADVSDHQIASFALQGGMIDGRQMQTELPRSVSGHGRKLIHLRVGLQGADLYRKDIDCTP